MMFTAAWTVSVESDCDVVFSDKFCFCLQPNDGRIVENVHCRRAFDMVKLVLHLE